MSRLGALDDLFSMGGRNIQIRRRLRTRRRFSFPWVNRIGRQVISISPTNQIFYESILRRRSSLLMNYPTNKYTYGFSWSIPSNNKSSSSILRSCEQSFCQIPNVLVMGGDSAFSLDYIFIVYMAGCAGGSCFVALRGRDTMMC